MWLNVGCISPHQSTAVDVDPKGWHQPAALLLPNTDTTSLRNLTFFLHCNARFKEDTLTVYVEIGTPDGLRHKEPFLMTISHSSRPAALLREVVIPYRNQVRFHRPGDYRITITPTRSVVGVEAAGININQSI